jgi:hypothetical protein
MRCDPYFTKGLRVIKYKSIAAEDGRVIVDHVRSLRVCSIHDDDDVVLSTLKGRNHSTEDSINFQSITIYYWSEITSN